MRNIKMVVIALVVAVSLNSCGYNTMVEKDELVTEKWAQVENVYQRRADLIPNLVNTVKGYATHEKSTLTEVMEARAKASSVTIDASKLDAAAIQRFQEAQKGLSGALSKLMMVSERYPDLKANKNFLELQAQLEGTENRIAVERKRFNETTQDYNTYIRKFPNNIIAGWFDFEKRDYFKADEGSKEVPKVAF